MELFDVFSTLTAGFALGIVVGHWLGKADRRMEYERGKLDGINQLWPHLTRAWVVQLIAEHQLAARNKADRDKAGA